MPTRTRQRAQSQSVEVGVVNQSDVLQTSYSFVQATTAGWSEVTTDVVTPRWLSKLQDGVIMMNPFDHVLLTETDKKATFDHMVKTSAGALWRYRSGTISSYAFMGRPQNTLVSLPTSNESTLRTQAITSAYAKVNESEALVLTTMAELQKTADTLADVLYKAYEILRLFKNKRERLLLNAVTRKLNLRRLRALGSSMTDYEQIRQLWLNYRYGIRPLVYDIRNLTNALISAGARRRFRFVSRKSEIQHNSVVQNKSYEYVNLRNVLNRTRKVEVLAGVLVEYDTTIMQRPVDTFGVLKAMQSAWELGPYTFIVDWLLNTADLVASWEVPEGRVVGSWATTTVTDTFRASCSEFASSLGTPWMVTLSVQPLCFISETKTRTRVANPEKPRTPSWRINLNKSKLLDVMALLGNLK